MFTVRMAAGTTPSIALLRSRLREAGWEPSLLGAGHAPERLDVGLRDQRFRAALFASFAVTALLLAAFGLYAVGAFDVSERQREMGIRMAIGAGRGRIQRLIVLQLLRPVAVGVVTGLLLCYWTGSLLQSFLHQVDARDPWTMAIVAVVLVATAALAAWLPARRAARVDPIVALRTQ
jgi:ABC-type antimicrobial peptide transport system permease subunit